MDYLQDFLDFCEYRRGLSKHTILTYRFGLSDYFEWLKGRNLGLLTIKVGDIDTYLIHLRKDKENSVSTMNGRMYALKSFYKWLQRMEVLDKNPLSLFQNTKEGKRLPKFLTPEQQEALLSACTKGNGNRRTGCDWISKRDHLLILLLLDTGLRIAEAVNIKPQDFDLNEGILKVRGKGNKERLIVLSDRVISAIKNYLKTIDTLEFNGTVPPGVCARGFNVSEIARELGISVYSILSAIHDKTIHSEVMNKMKAYIKERVKPLPLKFLFSNLRGESLGTRHAFRIVRDIGKKAGIQGLYPHELRHSHATNLRRKGAGLLLIKEALGHSSVVTTEMYAHLGNDEYKTKLRELVN